MADHTLEAIPAHGPDMQKVAESVTSLAKIVACPICLSLMKEPSRLPCCHYFCWGCAARALASGKAQCPICRKPATKRNLAKDELMGRLTGIYGELEAALGRPLSLTQLPPAPPLGGAYAPPQHVRGLLAPAPPATRVAAAGRLALRGKAQQAAAAADGSIDRQAADGVGTSGEGAQADADEGAGQEQEAVDEVSAGTLRAARRRGGAPGAAARLTRSISPADPGASQAAAAPAAHGRRGSGAAAAAASRRPGAHKGKQLLPGDVSDEQHAPGAADGEPAADEATGVDADTDAGLGPSSARTLVELPAGTSAQHATPAPSAGRCEAGGRAKEDATTPAAELSPRAAAAAAGAAADAGAAEPAAPGNAPVQRIFGFFDPNGQDKSVLSSTKLTGASPGAAAPSVQGGARAPSSRGGAGRGGARGRATRAAGHGGAGKPAGEVREGRGAEEGEGHADTLWESIVFSQLQQQGAGQQQQAEAEPQQQAEAADGAPNAGAAAVAPPPVEDRQGDEAAPQATRPGSRRISAAGGKRFAPPRASAGRSGRASGVSANTPAAAAAGLGVGSAQPATPGGAAPARDAAASPAPAAGGSIPALTAGQPGLQQHAAAAAAGEGSCAAPGQTAEGEEAGQEADAVAAGDLAEAELPHRPSPLPSGLVPALLLSPNSAAAAAAARRVPSRLLPWSCGVCTYENPQGAHKCKMCATAKPRGTSWAGEEGGTQGGASPAPEAPPAAAPQAAEPAGGAGGRAAKRPSGAAETAAATSSKRRKSAPAGGGAAAAAVPAATPAPKPAAATPGEAGAMCQAEAGGKQATNRKRKLSAPPSAPPAAGRQAHRRAKGGTTPPLHHANSAASPAGDAGEEPGSAAGAADAAADAASAPEGAHPLTAAGKAPARRSRLPPTPAPASGAAAQEAAAGGADGCGWPAATGGGWPAGCSSWVLLGSSLEDADKALMRRLAAATGARVVESFGPSVTHVMCRTDASRRARRTIKYLQGVVHGCWILDIGWASACLAAGGPVAEEGEWAVAGDQGGGDCGAAVARLRRPLLLQQRGRADAGAGAVQAGGEVPLPLAGVRVHIAPATPSRDDLAGLAKAMGATLVARLPHSAAALAALGSGSEGAQQQEQRPALPQLLVLTDAEAASAAGGGGAAARQHAALLAAAAALGLPLLSHRWLLDSAGAYRAAAWAPYAVAPPQQ